MAKEYKYKCKWSQHDGWHFSLGNKHLWGTKRGYMTADLITDETKKGELIEHEDYFTNHNFFDNIESALSYLRIESSKTNSARVKKYRISIV